MTQRVGVLLAVPDAEVVNPVRHCEIRNCKTYRIPGLIRTQSGTLLACFDARYENHLDLSADIDVAVSRSEDGGQTWSAPQVAMDAGPGKANGCGGPCILQDTRTGRIWVQALATHFDKNLGIVYEPAHVSETNDYHGMGFLRIPLSEVMKSGAGKK